jgi:hypothetical protein
MSFRAILVLVLAKQTVVVQMYRRAGEVRRLKEVRQLMNPPIDGRLRSA